MAGAWEPQTPGTHCCYVLKPTDWVSIHHPGGAAHCLALTKLSSGHLCPTCTLRRGGAVHWGCSASPAPEEVAREVSSWVGSQQMNALPVICPTFLREPGQHLWLQVSGAQGPSPSPAQAGCLSDYLTLRHMVPDTSVAREGLSSAYPLASWPLRMFSGAEHGPLLPD